MCVNKYIILGLRRRKYKVCVADDDDGDDDNDDDDEGRSSERELRSDTAVGKWSLDTNGTDG